MTATPDLNDIIAQATHQRAPGSVFSDVLKQHGMDVAMQAYIEALFTPHSIVRNCGKGLAPPREMQIQAKELAKRFLARLKAAVDEGEWFHYGETVSVPYIFIMNHLDTPADVAFLHLHSRYGLRDVDGNIKWFGHPEEQVQRYMTQHPPAPGELGPMLVPLIHRLDNGRSVKENNMNIDLASASALVHPINHFHGINTLKLLSKSPIYLMTCKQYSDDLLYPVDDNRCILDVAPQLLENVRAHSLLQVSDELLKPKVDQLFQGMQLRVQAHAERMLAYRRRTPGVSQDAPSRRPEGPSPLVLDNVL